MKKLLTSLTAAAALTMALSTSGLAQANEPTELTGTKAVLGDESQVIQKYSLSEIAPYATWTLDWPMAANEKAHSATRFEMGKGSTIKFDLTWSPQPDNVAVGLYNHDTGKYSWITNKANSPFKGSVSAPKQGTYSFALHNTSTTTAIKIKGDFTF